MGAVFKRTATKPLPVGAEFFVRRGDRLARWTDAKGRTHTAPVVVPAEGRFAGQERLAVETPTYTAKNSNRRTRITTSPSLISPDRPNDPSSATATRAWRPKQIPTSDGTNAAQAADVTARH